MRILTWILAWNSWIIDGMAVLYGYVRVLAPEDRPERQEEELEIYARASGYHLKHVYLDVGPPTKLNARGALDDLLTAAFANKEERVGIAFVDWSALGGRDLSTGVEMLGNLREAGIEVHLARPQVKLDITSVLAGLEAACAIEASRRLEIQSLFREVRRRRQPTFDEVKDRSPIDLIFRTRKVLHEITRIIEAGLCSTPDEREHLVALGGEADSILRRVTRKLDVERFQNSREPSD